MVNVPPVSCSVVSLPLRGLDQRLALPADLAEAQGVSVAEHRDDHAGLDGHADPDIDLAVADDRVGLERGVHAGVASQGQRDGLGDEVAERELDLFGGEPRVQALADRDQLVDPGVDSDVDRGGDLHGLDHPLGDRLAHPGVRDAFGGQLPGGGRGARGPRGRGGLLGTRLEERLDVAADHPTAGSAPADPRRSTCDSLAIFRASGLDLTRPPAGAGAGSGSGSATGVDGSLPLAPAPSAGASRHVHRLRAGLVRRGAPRFRARLGGGLLAAEQLGDLLRGIR